MTDEDSTFKSKQGTAGFVAGLGLVGLTVAGIAVTNPTINPPRTEPVPNTRKHTDGVPPPHKYNPDQIADLPVPEGFGEAPKPVKGR